MSKENKLELTNLTLVEAASLLAAARISPVELTQAYLARIAQLDPALHSFITVTAELALAAAQEAEASMRQRGNRGPLHGIPLALKDVFELQGVRTTAGAYSRICSLATKDSAVVQRLKESGAIILGKLNMYEWAMKASSDNSTFGDCRNPWDLECTAGGSSSGSAVAAGLCVGALGSDTGDSVRIPASLCGVVGFKPGYGRISKRDMLPLSWSLDHVGLMARRIQDVALLLQVLAGYDPQDPCSINIPVDEYIAHLNEGVRGWRIAVAYQPFLREGEQADAEVLQAVHEAARVFEQLGASVNEVEMPQGPVLRDCNSTILLSEAAYFHREQLQTAPGVFSPAVLESLRQGMTYTARDYVQTREIQVQARRQFELFFEEYDLILSPTTPTAADRPVDAADTDMPRASLTSFTSAWNLLGFPAISLPCGFTKQGLPTGLQIVGPMWAEARVLCAGSAYEQATSWHERTPPLDL
ncbi:MAG TPA: amidase [Ktedonosporobacter sp.]|jgi:aspartyl-tRNA(Asn)/glutamyl-tRNA(Gln) amidotransferase subunit A|nr:amidase [Ktedonosporobacter sp.]